MIPQKKSLLSPVVSGLGSFLLCSLKMREPPDKKSTQELEKSDQKSKRNPIFSFLMSQQITSMPAHEKTSNSHFHRIHEPFYLSLTIDILSTNSQKNYGLSKMANSRFPMETTMIINLKKNADLNSI